MRKMAVKLSFFLVASFLLYGAVRMRGISVPFLDACISTCAYPLILLQKTVLGPIQRYMGTYSTYGDMQELYHRSQQERERLLQENIELQSLLTVSTAYEELREFKRRYVTNACISTQVIGRQFGREHFYFLDAGTNRGVELDMVAVYKNCLLGRVTQVYPRYCKVLLITDSLCKVAALCKNSRDQAIHEGIGSSKQTKLTYVFDSALDLEKRLKQGDLVVSSGEGLIFPKGFGLGKIDAFKTEELQCSVTLSPLIDFNVIDYCYLIAKGGEYNEMLSPEIGSKSVLSTEPIKSTKATNIPITQQQPKQSVLKNKPKIPEKPKIIEEIKNEQLPSAVAALKTEDQEIVLKEVAHNPQHMVSPLKLDDE